MRPVIYEYEDYRTYLGDWLAHLSEVDPDFSQRKFAKKANFGSPSYFKMIIEGKRRIGPQSIGNLCRALELDESEADYFELLVNYNQSKKLEDANRFYRKMKDARDHLGFQLVSGDQYEFYSQWYHSAIRELVDTADFKLDFHWIAESLDPPISVREAKKSWELLKRLGMVQKKKGKWAQADSVIATDANVPFEAFANYYESMGELGIRSLHEVDKLERDLSAITLGIHQEDFGELCEKLSSFRHSLVKHFNSKKPKPDRVYQLNFQVFPLDNRSKK